MAKKCHRPRRKGLYVFCADHGIVDAGVTRYPQSVTRQMIRNFVDGGAAINVLCRRLQIRPMIIDMGACGPPVPGALNRKIDAGTKNFLEQPAMTREQAENAMQVGHTLADEAAGEYDVVGLGEMGIGNTSSASALFSAFSGRSAQETAGPGAGLDEQGVHHKAEILARALMNHKVDPADPVGVLATFGGFEIAAIAGFVLRASQLRLPVVVDGFPCSAGALVAKSMDSTALSTTFFSHTSGEPAHRLMLEYLNACPYFNLGLRLGEGTGAALMIGIIDSAVRLYREMATFVEAGVSDAG